MQKKISLLKSSILKNIILTVLFAIVILGSFVSLENYTRIKKIKVTSSKKNSNIKGLNNFKNKSLLFTLADSIKNELSLNNPQISTIKIVKNYPDELHLNIEFSRPISALKVSGGYFFLDREGKILFKKTENSENYPIINFYQKFSFASFEAGQSIDYKDIKTSLHFIVKTSGLGLKPVTIDIGGLSMIAFNLEKGKVFFTTEKDISVQDYQLESVVKQFKIQGKDFKILDLRFDKPVVQF